MYCTVCPQLTALALDGTRDLEDIYLLLEASTTQQTRSASAQVVVAATNNETPNENPVPTTTTTSTPTTSTPTTSTPTTSTPTTSTPTTSSTVGRSSGAAPLSAGAPTPGAAAPSLLGHHHTTIAGQKRSYLQSSSGENIQSDGMNRATFTDFTTVGVGAPAASSAWGETDDDGSGSDAADDCAYSGDQQRCHSVLLPVGVYLGKRTELCRCGENKLLL
eukprot:1174202-Pyramimonas_sp.AAC.1